MTISSTTSEVSYAGNGVTLAFDIPFVFDTSADLLIYEQVVSTGVVTQRTTGIVVSGGDGSTGTLTYSVAPPTGTNITILDNPERTQTHDYVENDPFPAESHEGALDKLTRLAKRLYQTSLKSLRVADGDAYTSMVLPTKVGRASKFLAFDANGNPIASAAVSDGDALLRAELIAGATSLVNSTGIKYDITAAEITAGVTPVDYSYPPGRDKRYGVMGDGVTDDATAVNNWWKVSASHAAIGTPGAQYLCKSTVNIPGHGCLIDLNGGTLICDVGAGNTGIGFTLVGGTAPPSGCYLKGWVTLKTGLRGVNILANSLTVDLAVAVKNTADAAAIGVALNCVSAINGPYYVRGVIEITGQSSGTQIGFKSVGSGGTVRVPNADKLHFPNIAGFTTAMEVQGHGNRYTACFQGCTNGVKFTLPGATQTTENWIEVFYMENVTNGAICDAGTLGNRVDFNYTTGVTTLFTDNDGSNYYTTDGDWKLPGGLFNVKAISSTATPGKNLCGIITISGASTTGTVTFANIETNTSYRAVACVTASTGTPAAGSTRLQISSKSVSGFTVVPEAAPGVGNSITVDWMILR